MHIPPLNTVPEQSTRVILQHVRETLYAMGILLHRVRTIILLRLRLLLSRN